MAVIPLCVPFERKDEARQAGARWDATQRVWTCQTALLSTDAYARLRRFVPRMYRPDLQPPYIRPWMVPQTVWGKNLRALLLKKEWDVIRKAAYAASGNRCRVCGGRGPQWPVEADEAWEYNDETRTQTLKGVIALCPDCHHIRHWGKTMVDGHEEQAFILLMHINRWTRTQAEDAVAFAFDQWERRSRHEWESDYSWVTRVHGFRPDGDGERRAKAVNRELVNKAAARTGLFEQETAMGHIPDEQPTKPKPEPTIRMRSLTQSSIMGYLRKLTGR